MNRRFEFIAGNFAKFWDVTQADQQVTVHYGRIGTAGQTQAKSFPSPDAARRHAQQQIDSKVRKGYVECSEV